MLGIFSVDSIDYLFQASFLLIRTMCVDCDIHTNTKTNIMVGKAKNSIA